jgi:hypothetical protein
MFQTPTEVAEYMCCMIPSGSVSILEPTPGEGNILQFLDAYQVTAPENYFDLQQSRFDCIVMNPPFSSKYVFGVPDSIDEKGMKIGYRILFDCMEMSDHVIALMPWFLILDSSVRLEKLVSYVLKSITALPRSTFEYARIQCCVFELHKGWNRPTEFRSFNFPKKRKRADDKIGVYYTPQEIKYNEKKNFTN